jgi:penicillin amidase
MNPVRSLVRLLGRRLATTSGSLQVPGIDRPVRIRRDRFGVPHIEAETDADAWFGIGFCHGQDRPFQLETRLRAVRGTLAALIGPDGLPIDRLSRRIGFRRHGEAAVATLHPSHRQLADAYAAGITAGATRGLKRRPHAFALLRSRPTRYEAADALGFLSLMAFSLASNWDAELARLKMLTLDGAEAVAALDPTYPSWQAAAAAPSRPVGEEAARAQLDRLADDLTMLAGIVGTGGGSNSWALSAGRTASGRPLLANDPHLAPVLPGHWYLLHVVTPEWAVAGASLAGAPAVAAGHNGHAAWGVTAGLTDNTDLFLEEMGGDGRSVRRGDDFVPCEAIPEVITVRGAEPVDLDVLITDRGPIVGPAFDGEMGALSLSATWLQPGSLGAVFDLVRIRSFDEMATAFERFPGLPLNVIYADVEGTIGWQLIGDAPRRRAGNGALPLPAWSTEPWRDGPVPFAALPNLVDPGDGLVASANNLPHPDAAWLGVDFLDGYRFSRIVEGLAARRDWDVPSTLRFQMDRTSLPWRELREPVLAALESDPGPASDMLRDWDGVLDPGSPAATLFELMVGHLAVSAVRSRAPRSAAWALGRGFTPLVPFNGFIVRRVSHLVRLVREQPDGWFDEGWGERIRTAVSTSWDRLVDELGPDPADWAWGRVRRLTLTHPLGLRPPLDKVFNLGPLTHGGDANTVNPAPVDPTDPLAHPDFAIASLRMVIDLGDWEQCRFVLPGGQSGNPFSRHYGDQLVLWHRGDALPIAWSPAMVDRAAREELVLRPAEEGSRPVS